MAGVGGVYLLPVKPLMRACVARVRSACVRVRAEPRLTLHTLHQVDIMSGL